MATTPPPELAKTFIYHITDVANLAEVIHEGRLLSDIALAATGKSVVKIGYDHLKQRRMHRIRIPCADNRLVGEFVPFYFCPRSPMLFTVNRGNTGREPGCQRTILHLVSTVPRAHAQGRAWAFSDGNAAAGYPTFFNDLKFLPRLDWDAIGARTWEGRTNQKCAEFLVAEEFSWEGISFIGCFDDDIAHQVATLLQNTSHRPQVLVRRNWYY